MKVITIVGARPQFIKVAPVSLELRAKNIKNILVHTGQHYDMRMSDIFFKELNIPEPDYHLGVGSGSHGTQTGRMLQAIEVILMKEKPHWVLVYGDTNSTLAGALAAVKLRIPVVHIEAGLRSYNFNVPEEINRRLTDHMSRLLLCPTKQAVDNLDKEGFTNIIDNGELIDIKSIVKLHTVSDQPVTINVGDVMYDLLRKTDHIIDKNSIKILHEYKIEKGEYILATIHRAENTDYKEHLENIIRVLSFLEYRVIWTLHPRTKNRLEEFDLIKDISRTVNIQTINPVGYKDMISLQKNAKFVFTDSGGVQKEAYLLGVPCLTCRDETEWTETLESGWNHLIGIGASQLKKCFPFGTPRNINHKVYGDGSAAKRIIKILIEYA
ncbi:MAG: hypothetical protein APF76_12235 [Desulfitibacter sp. BRH_c19]|nr:MAG: hypothetical protein APF76_12235 [Desulfitibacter sp. BRH_c19]